MTTQDTTRIADDLATDSTSLVKKLKGWNLIIGLYSEPSRTEEDLVHAYAQEARDIVQMMVRVLCDMTSAALRGKTERAAHMKSRLVQMAEREKHLATLCNTQLNTLAKEVGA